MVFYLQHFKQYEKQSPPNNQNKKRLQKPSSSKIRAKVVLIDQQFQWSCGFTILRKNNQNIVIRYLFSFSTASLFQFFLTKPVTYGLQKKETMNAKIKKVNTLDLIISETLSLAYLLFSAGLVGIAVFIPKIGKMDVWKKAFQAHGYAKGVSEFGKLPVTIHGVRASMLQLPLRIQPVITYITGKPFDGEKPWSRSNLSYLWTTLLALMLGLFLSFSGFKNESILLVLIGWLLTVYSVRKVGPVLNHYISHKDFFDKMLREYLGEERSVKHQRVLGELLASLFSLQNQITYIKEHIGTKGHHNENVTATSKDADNYFLNLLGFKAGMTKHQLYRRFFELIVNPFSKLQSLFFVSRLKSQFDEETTFLKKMVSFFFLVLPFSFAWHIGFMMVIVTWWIPVFLLTPVAALLQFASEHFWNKETNEFDTVEHLSKREKIVRSKKLTVGRFCGEALPFLDGKILFNTTVIFIWTIRMLKHLFIRIVVLQGDLVAHDLHHRVKYGFDWSNWLFTRVDFSKNKKEGDEPLVDVWGYGNVLETIFDSMSSMKPKMEYDPEMTESFSAERAVLGM